MSWDNDIRDPFSPNATKVINLELLFHTMSTIITFEKVSFEALEAIKAMQMRTMLYNFRSFLYQKGYALCSMSTTLMPYPYRTHQHTYQSLQLFCNSLEILDIFLNVYSIACYIFYFSLKE